MIADESRAIDLVVMPRCVDLFNLMPLDCIFAKLLTHPEFDCGPGTMFGVGNVELVFRKPGGTA